MYRKITAALLVATLSACAQPAPSINDYKFDYANSSYEDDNIAVSIKYAGCGRVTVSLRNFYGCEGYVLTVTNKTKSDIFVDWNKTSYISGSETNGGFMFEGVVYRDRAQPKPDSVVFPNVSMTKVIWPNVLVHFGEMHWVHEYIPYNPNGVYLVVKDGAGKETRAKLLATVDYMGKL